MLPALAVFAAGLLFLALRRSRLARGRSSTTAAFVAFWRALGHLGATTIPGFSDPYARRLLDGRWLRRLERFERGEPLTGYERGVDAVLHRVAFLDLELRDHPTPQVVVLGAGFDTRAWRLDVLTDAVTFEVDHPATQAVKRERAGVLGPTKGGHRWVPVDFARDALDDALAAAGHDAALPTSWVWEGVVLYLDDDAVRATLRAVRRRSAPGSRLLLHYHEPESRWWAAAGRWILFRVLGEPQIGLRRRERMRALVEEAGFAVVADVGTPEMAARDGGSASTFSVAHVSRIVVAEPGAATPTPPAAAPE